VREEPVKTIPPPSVTSAPPGQSVVNFFTIISTPPSPEDAITFTNPVPGEVRGVPEYSWCFGDGLKGMGPGTAFNPAVLPSRNPGYYLWRDLRQARHEARDPHGHVARHLPLGRRDRRPAGPDRHDRYRRQTHRNRPRRPRPIGHACVDCCPTVSRPVKRTLGFTSAGVVHWSPPTRHTRALVWVWHRLERPDCVNFGIVGKPPLGAMHCPSGGAMHAMPLGRGIA
jgi:hypothetical protein